MALCGYECTRYLMIAVNIIVWLLGCVLLGVGIWLRVDKDILDFIEIINVDRDDPYLDYTAYIIVAVGSFIFLIGLCGCCGAYQESGCLLATYTWVLIIILVLELTAMIMTAVFRVRVTEYLETAMVKQVKKYYKGNNTLAVPWDIMQMRLECCGSRGPFDYVDSFWYNSSSARAGDLQLLYVPITCCVLNEKVLSPTDADPLNLLQCQAAARINVTSSQYLHVKGCHEALFEWLYSHTSLILAVVVIIIVTEVSGIIAGCQLMRKIRQSEQTVKPR